MNEAMEKISDRRHRSHLLAYRPTASADWWEDDPDILAGKDLVRGGTWLGVSRKGRFAFLTNFREVRSDPRRLL